MRKLLTGYGLNFNRRHKRIGHPFQNRYRSILCEEDPSLLEIARHILLALVAHDQDSSGRSLSKRGACLDFSEALGPGT